MFVDVEFKRLQRHRGHDVRIVSYENSFGLIENMSLICEDCSEIVSEVVLDYDRTWPEKGDKVMLDPMSNIDVDLVEELASKGYDVFGDEFVIEEFEEEKGDLWLDEAPDIAVPLFDVKLIDSEE